MVIVRKSPECYFLFITGQFSIIQRDGDVIEPGRRKNRTESKERLD